MNLNERQIEAVQYNGGPLLIIAGAGTGKTSVITQRILHIINEDWAKSDEILALTFTEKAADEMIGRVEENLPYGYGDMWISTFHSFCDRVLRQEGYHIGLDTGYSLMTSAQSYVFFKKHLFEFPLERFRQLGNPTFFIDGILKHFSRLQDEDVSSSDYISFAKGLPQGTDIERDSYEDINELAKVYEKYLDLKMKESKLDFGDLIILTIKLFREKPSVLEKYRKQFKYILVDEYQDTNYTQSVLVNILAGLDPRDPKASAKDINPNITVVGDDDQAIYKFRGAAISNILQFKKHYPNTKEVVLIENYRSKQDILDGAYRLIKHNDPFRLEVTEKIDKRLLAKGEFNNLEKDSIKLITAQSEDIEAEWIAREIRKLTGNPVEDSVSDKPLVFDDTGQAKIVGDESKEKYRFCDIAILARANSHLDSVIQNLRYFGIPYRIGGSRGLYFREEIKDLIAYLKVLINYKDDISAYRLLCFEQWAISPREYIELNRISRSVNDSVLEMLEKNWNIKLGEEEEIGDTDSEIIKSILSEESISGITNLLNILNNGIKNIKKGSSTVSILYDFVKDSGYLNILVSKGGHDSEFITNNIGKFLETVKQFEKDNLDTNIYEYVDFLDYSIEIGDSPLVEQELDDFNAVNILTVHSSKGLEFPVVFMINLVKDRFPSRDRKDKVEIPNGLIKEILTGLTSEEENLQEERRLFYVGATRAKEKLYLTASVYYGNGKQKKRPSMFLSEIMDREVLGEFDRPLLTKENGYGNISFNDGRDSIMIEDMEYNYAKKVSYSQLNEYDQCPKMYYFDYIMGIPSYQNASLSFGTTVHNTLKDFYTLLKQHNEGLGLSESPTLEDLLSLYEKNWVRGGYDSKEHELSMKKRGVEQLKKYFDKFYSLDQKPYRLEESFSVHLGNTSFGGKIDRMDLIEIDNEGRAVVEIIDYKTGKTKKEDNIKKDLQLPIYALFAERSFGIVVRSAKYIFLGDCIDIPVDISEERRVKAEVEMMKLIDCIKSKNFDAKPDMFKCKGCSFRSICSDSLS